MALLHPTPSQHFQQSAAAQSQGLGWQQLEPLLKQETARVSVA